MRTVRRRLKLLPEQKSKENEEEENKDRPNSADARPANDVEHIIDASTSTLVTAVAPPMNGEQTLTRTGSHHSKASKKPKTPVFAPAAPALDSDSDSDSDDDSDDFDEHAFDHPSTYADQPWIWIPKDGLGLSQLLVSELKQGGVEASDVGAVMDDKGTVEVIRNPPDEDWSGGHDL
jgi:calcium permeable stress-gated cation channel